MTDLALVATAWSVAATLVLVVRLARTLASRYVAAQRKLAEADFASLFIFLDGRMLISASVLAGCLVLVILLLLGVPWALATGGFLLCLLGPRILLRTLRKRRTRKLYEQFPDALGFWAGLLASGQSLHSSLVQLSERQPRPLGDELRLLVRQTRLGLPLEEGMDALCVRVGVADLTLVATLLRVSRELGGNLAESLQRLAHVLRERLATEARIRSLTAQGRLQGWIVGMLPVLLLAVLTAMEPATMGVLFSEPAGWAALGLVVVLEATGILLIRRIVSIEV